MRVDYVSSYTQKSVNSRQNVNAVSKPVNTSVGISNIVKLSFTGKNINQLASLTPENNGLGLAETSQGGEGCVGYEIVESMRKHENMDARSFMPFWEHNNPKGGYKFLIHRK